MIERLAGRLRQPGGTIGLLSLVSAAVLAVVGAVGVVGMLITLLSGSDWWSDSDSDVVVAMVLFAVTFLGAVGFLLEDRLPWQGATLAVVGGLAMALVLFWTFAAIVLGLGAAVVGVLRARAMLHGPTAEPRHAA